MVEAFFGDHAIPYAVLYDSLGSFPALASYGSVIVGLYGYGEKQPTWQGYAVRFGAAMPSP